MARKGTFSDTHDATVYAYGLVPTAAFPEAAIDNLFNANQFWNGLVAIHNESRERYEKALREAHTEYAAAAQAWDAANVAVDAAFEAKRNARLKAGTRDANHPLIAEANAGISVAKQKRSELWHRTVKQLRAAAKRAVDTKAFNDETRAKIKALYAETEISGVNKDAVVDSFNEARKRVLKEGGRLNFKKFDGTGRWAFRFRVSGNQTDGITIDQFFAQGDRAPVHVTAPVGGKKKERLATRIKVTGGRRDEEKVFANFDLIYHRPLPADAIIVNSEVTRRRTGDRFKYMICLTLRVPKKDLAYERAQFTAGIDIGWRENGDGSIQSAMIATSGGGIEKIVIPTHITDRLNHVERLQGELSDSAADLGRAIKPLLRGGAVVQESHPKIRMIRAVALMPQNRTLPYELAYKLTRFVMREPGTLPGEVETSLLDWHNKNGRHYREMHNLRVKALGERKHFYRNIASRLCQRHAVIGIEQIDLSVMAERKDADNKLANKALSNRFRAGISELTGALENAARHTGTKVIEVSAAYTSKTCNDCGTINKALTAEREWECESCGAEHDRDENAAKNILVSTQKKAQETQICEAALA